MFTFAFADIAGFTALTEAHGDDAGADLAEAFADRVRVMLPRDSELVKTIGDAAMIRFEDPTQAVRTAVLIAGGILGEDAAPAVRVGLHTGSAVQRGTDWFGAAVNIAARVAGRARGGETLLTAATKDAVHRIDGVVLEEAERVALRNVAEPVHLWRARRTADPVSDAVLDPVCHMALSLARSVGSLEHAGARYHFCSLRCVAAFAAHPERYAGNAGAVG